MRTSKADWNLFLEKLPAVQERYMKQLCRGYVELLSDETMTGTERFWKLEERLGKDKEFELVSFQPEKKYLDLYLAGALREEIITMDDLEGFSETVLNRVKSIME